MEPAVPKRAAKGGRSKKRASAEATPASDEGGDAIIRCICGYVEEDEDDDRVMVICDQCDAWQHNECMEISENQEELPEQYYCEQCRPEDHKGLLAKVARGERPWEERAKQRALEEEERKAKRRKGGKKGKKGRASELKSEKSEETNGSGPPAQSSPVQESPIVKPENGQKRKFDEESSGDKGPQEQVSQIYRTTFHFKRLTVSQESLNKVRKVSSSKDMKSSKPTALPAPARQDSKGVALQTELVENISELQSDTRKRAANALVRLFVDQTKAAQKQGTFKLPPGQPLEAFGLRLGLAVEYAIYLNFWGHSTEHTPEYGEKLRTMLHNVKANPSLRDRLLNGSLSPNEFSKMSSFDMASKELQEKTAEMKKDAEKQHMLIQEEGPRIRRTHKGEEFVGDATQHVAGTESIFSNAPTRRRESDIDTTALRQGSPKDMSPQTPNAVEFPNSMPYSGTAASPTSAKPLTVDTKVPSRPSVQPTRQSSSNFNIQNVWSSVDSPDVDKQRARQLSVREASTNIAEQRTGPAVAADADIDQLLKDEEPDDEEPYSPTDYTSEPGTVWHGKVIMASIAQFGGTAKHVAGANLSTIYPWDQMIPASLSIEGRIAIERASTYLCGLQWSKTTDVSVVSVSPSDSPEDKTQFDTLFNYFTERNRYGVVAKSPIPAVRDVYVVPLDSGVSAKPDFVELLEYCTIEEPRPERMLLLTYVVKTQADGDPSAQATPRHLDSAAVASPVTNHVPHQYQTPVPVGQPGMNMSPPPPYSVGSYQPAYGSPSQPQQGFAPVPQPPAMQAFNSSASVGIEAARKVLGDMASAPAVSELLSIAPNTGEGEFGVIRDVFDSVPACRNDFTMLTGILNAKHQQGAGAGS